MKIINIDAPKHLVEKVVYFGIPEFILDVMRPLERHSCVDIIHRQLLPNHRNNNIKTSLPLSPIRMFDKAGYENIGTLIHTIPIYLRGYRPEEICDEDCIIDLLGAYYSNRKGDSPYIELYLSAIDRATLNNDQHFKWLFTKVLIHELAHAALDIFNWEHNCQKAEKVQYSSEFGKWREESMANAVALRIVKDYGDNDFYDYAKKFMLSQSLEYALGVLMEDFGYWDFRSVFEAKERGVDSELQKEWLEYAKGNPDWTGLEKWNEILFRGVVYFFEGKYYTSEGELICDIVNKVLADYETQNGTKMPFSEFSSLFPCIKIGAMMSYETSDMVKWDNSYCNRMELQDGDYYLYKYWNSGSLLEFLANVNLPLNIYKNC